MSTNAAPPQGSTAPAPLRPGLRELLTTYRRLNEDDRLALLEIATRRLLKRRIRKSRLTR